MIKLLEIAVTMLVLMVGNKVSEHYKPAMLELHLSNGRILDVMVDKKNNYSCPKHCASNHFHNALVSKNNINDSNYTILYKNNNHLPLTLNGIDIVNIFRTSKEAPIFAEQTVKIGAKVLWLQFGIQNQRAQEIVESANMTYIANKCIKQEYQKLFLKMSPVFPVLQ